jgi:hypothetical protein
MRKLLPCLISGSCAALLVCLVAEEAHAADLVLGAQAGVAVATQDVVKLGFGVDGLVGCRFQPGPVWVQPEAMGGVRGFGNNAEDADFSATFGRVTAGMRVGLGGLVEPQVYAHLGGAFGGASGFTADVGGALDLKLSRLFIGAHVGFAGIAQNRQNLDWIDIGGHIGLVL